MKFSVGVMLTSFGTFWGAEGAGASWPGGDAALLVIVPLRRRDLGRDGRLAPRRARGRREDRGRRPQGGRVIAFARGMWEFVVGDDWITAAGVVVALGATALVAGAGVAAWWVMPVAVVALLALALRRAARK